MKWLTLLLASFGLQATSAFAASIGVFTDPNCSSCNLSIPDGSTRRIFISAQPSELEPDRPDGAEFRVVGLPSGWTTLSTPNPAAFLAIGDPFSAGTNIAFLDGQPGSCVNLFVVDITASTNAQNVTLQVTAHQSPSNPNFACPLLSMDWSPVYPLVCVEGGAMYANSQEDCVVAAYPSTWSKAKGLFRD